MIENTVKIWRLNVRKRAAHVRGSAPLSLLLAMWTWGKLTYGLKNMINLLLLYCRADQCESDGNYRNSVNTLVYSYLLLWQHLPRWEWYLCRMLGPLPVCTWLDGVLSKNGMILSRRDGFASYFKDVLSEQNWLNDKTDRCPQFFSAVTIKLNPKISHKDLYWIHFFSGFNIWGVFGERIILIAFFWDSQLLKY